MTVDQLSSFYAIGPSVQPRLDFGVYIIFHIVNFLSSAHLSDVSFKFLRNQMYQSTEFNIDNFHFSFRDANLLILHVFDQDQYPFQTLTDNTGYLFLLRAFKWIYQPHSLASLMKHSSMTWLQLFDLLLTWPPATTEDPVDTTVEACADRLLALHPDNRSILDLYSALAKDPSLVSEYLLSIGAYDNTHTPTRYGLQLSIVASCLVSYLQDEFESINVDRYLSQSDLLFILSAGDVYNGSLGPSRSFTSNLFNVYASVKRFLSLYPQLLTMDYSVLILPPPKSMTENVSVGKWTAYIRMLLATKTREMFRHRKFEAFHRPPQYGFCSPCVAV